MALISCIECGKKISSSAKVCPECGNPMGLSQLTIEKTSKEIKGKVALAVGVMILSAIIAAYFGFCGNYTLAIVFGVIYLISLIRLIVLGAKRWWHHG
jgi:uncharacterized membrane protein YvbJ